MIKKGITLSLVSVLFLLLGFTHQTKAQESLINDVSYVYIEKLVAVALENFPRIKSSESKVRIAEANISRQKIGWLSPFSLSYVHSPSNSLNILNPTFFSGYQFGIFISFGSLLQTPFNVKASREELKVVKNDIAEYTLTLTTEVKRRYITYLSSLKAVQIAAKSAVDAQTSATLTKYKFERGETSLSDYNNALDRLGVQNQAKTQAEANLIIAKFGLEELLGVKLEEVK